jgi:Rad3-related DNA helicase
MTDQLDTKEIRALADALEATIGRLLLPGDMSREAEAMRALCDALDELRADNERLQTIIGNLHTVEEELSETAKAQFHRANRLRAENQRLRNFIVDFSETKFDRIDRRSLDPQDDLDPLTDYLAIEAWQDDARAALAQKGGE